MPSGRDSLSNPIPERGTVVEVFLVFLKLGVSSFGGPIAHLGYYRNELVVRRKWLDETTYADLVALCQFLPGPASSQAGFSLGVLRGNGLLGGLAAWFAFTMPSAVIMFAFAMGAASFTGPVAEGFLHGLKLVAVAVVAQAIWGMACSLTPDRPRAAIALAAVAVVVTFAGSIAQIAAIALGACAGLWLCRGEAPPVSGHLNFPVTRLSGGIALLLFAALLLLTPVLAAASGSHTIAMFDAFYRSGALVFGGGHVVLPLLQAQVVSPGWVSNETFLAGYGLAQAVPGPLFTFAAYLGAVMNSPPNGLAGAAIALVALLLPGMLLVYGMLPFWDAMRARPAAQAALRGTNAAVVGILGAALYSPVWTSAVMSGRDFALALAGFLLLTVWKLPSWVVVVLLAAAGTLSPFV
ncbi:MAG TPA: chromate efflux transporter [Bradyrhizobium sp.]|uniref:chromate efflux transporter n=1 Tax=Bradyrhizobium sp. TaxID=376 RepID=UPI002BB96B3A|nr:chromate efflux transporter [Bradyrhizobium sp.]HTC96507.1 chromate efflux transporter [Bradyrhizobium sp.]HXB80551.1 chromate efflux transporter [Bradyrhizobium sp.]